MSNHGYRPRWMCWLATLTMPLWLPAFIVAEGCRRICPVVAEVFADRAYWRHLFGLPNQ